MQDDDSRQFLAAIKEMADIEKSEVHSRSEQEVARINERTEAQIRQLREEALARLDDQLRVESECIIGRTELEIRDRLIRQKNEVLGEVFERASRQIAELDNTETYKRTFKRLVKEAIDRINCEDVRLRISNIDLPLWEVLKGNFPASISVMPRDGPRGMVIVETNDGSQSIDNSIETRLETAKEVMRRELIEMLFDTETSGEAGE